MYTSNSISGDIFTLGKVLMFLERVRWGNIRMGEETGDGKGLVTVGS